MGLDPSSRQHPLATIGPAALVLDAGHNRCTGVTKCQISKIFFWKVSIKILFKKGLSMPRWTMASSFLHHF